jgi:hypothetical protein
MNVPLTGHKIIFHLISISNKGPEFLTVIKSPIAFKRASPTIIKNEILFHIYGIGFPLLLICGTGLSGKGAVISLLVKWH